MDIDWMALVKVALVSFAFGVGLVMVFSLGIVGSAGFSHRNEAGSGADGVQFGDPDVRRTPLAAALAIGCFALCAIAVLYGLWLIVPQFHD